jgi:hypothetical protein
MIRAHVASTAGRSVPIARKPSARGFPMIGPSPSIAVMASTTVRCGRTVEVRSRIDAGMLRMCRMFFGHP